MIESNSSILETVQNIRKRRFIFRDKTTGWKRHYFKTKQTNASKVSRFIELYTKGRFYLDPSEIAFEDEKDYVIFAMVWSDE